MNCLFRLLIYFFVLGSIINNLHSFELSLIDSLTGQRRDGSQLFDVCFKLDDMSSTDSVNIFINTFTQSGETLTCETFVSPSDTGKVFGPGQKHIIWDIGRDEPGREFYSDSIVIKITAGISGWDPDICFSRIYISDWYNHRVVRIDDMSGTNWVSYGSASIFDGVVDAIIGYDNKIYLVDSGNGKIVIIDDMMASGWCDVGGFSRPRDIDIGPDGKIYIAEQIGYCITKIDDISGTGRISYGSPGTGVGQFGIPCGVKIGPDDKIYIADMDLHRIVRIDDMSGSNWTTYGTLGSGPNMFNAPYDIAFDEFSRIYIADWQNSRIVRIDDITGTGWVSLSGFNQPLGVEIGPDGRIYVADSWFHRIVRIDDMDGLGWISYGVEGTGIGQFSYPFSVSFGP